MPGPPPDFRELFEQSPAPYLVLSPELAIVAVSDAYLRATMTKRDEILGRGIFDVFPDNPDEVAANGVSNLRASLERVLLHRQPDTMAVQKYDIRRPESAGGGFEERHWSPVNSPVLRKGHVAYIIHRVEDVTDFARLQSKGNQAILESDKLRSQVTEMGRELFARAQELQRANEQLRRQHFELQGRVALTHEELAQEVNARQATEEALKRSEEQLRQAQKLEAVGRLAAGIAHDFNNLLSVVLGYAEELLLELPKDGPRHDEVNEIKLAGERAADLVRQLLIFSRQQLLAPKIVDLNALVESACRMLGRLVGEQIELAFVPGANLGPVKVDPGQLEQVVVNLVVNARDAMPNGGKLTIATSNVDLDEIYAAEHLAVVPGPYVMLSVSDTGVGMDRKTQDRLFEPFFTTKAPGQGSGLGLSTVFGIVKQSHGSVWVYSEPGHGTTFKIYLPRTDRDSVRPVQPAPTQRGTETILLVEDEAQVRAIVKRTLERGGYAVLSASNPEEALRLCETSLLQIDLLLTDVVMPQMNGRELAERIRVLRPTIKTLFMSGYTDDAILRHGVLDEGVPFLQKPVTPGNLTRKVRETLDARR
ncbi:MAG TPA: ATP-binding protein [Polyangiaceae bacterium]|nr:ATP-binding protein [Polyangiaceae bacterium]